MSILVRYFNICGLVCQHYTDLWLDVAQSMTITDAKHKHNDFTLAHNETKATHSSDP